MAETGQRQVSKVVLIERGTLVAIIDAVSGTLNRVSPLMVFPRVNFKPHMLNGAPPGSIGRVNINGWSNERIFYDYLLHFIASTT